MSNSSDVQRDLRLESLEKANENKSAPDAVTSKAKAVTRKAKQSEQKFFSRGARTDTGSMSKEEKMRLAKALQISEAGKGREQAKTKAVMAPTPSSTLNA